MKRSGSATETLVELMRLLGDGADGAVRRRLLAALALAIAGSVLAALAPLALKHLVDALRPEDGPRPQGHTLLILGLGGAYLLALGAGRALAEARLLLAATAEQHLQARLSRRYFAHLLALPLGFHVDRSTGTLTNGLFQAVAGCQLGLSSLLHCLPVLVEVLTVLVVLGYLGQPALAAVFGASALAYGVVFAVSASRVRQRGRSVAQAAQGQHRLLADSLLNIETIQCFGASAIQRKRFDNATAELEHHWTDLNRQRAGTGLVVAAVFTTSVGSSLWVAGQAVTAGTLTLGGFVLATVYMLQMVRPLELLGGATRDLAQALEFVRPLVDVMRCQPEGPVRSSAQEGSMVSCADEAAAGPPALSFRDVHLTYGHARPALRGLGLHLPAGCMVALVGHSGAGKSSVARLLLGLHTPSSGRILWNGSPIEQIDLATRRRRIAIVSQDTTLLGDSIAANIAIGRPDASRRDIEDAARQAQLHAFVAALPEGYETQVGERGLKLSGGERQRIAIARAILMQPQVFVLDEVTSMLDAATEAALLENLRQVCAGRTTLLITHRLSAARLADRIVVMDAGRLVEEGTHAELLGRRGAYRQLWLAQRQDQPAQPSPAADALPCASAEPATRPFVRRQAARRRRA